MCCDVIGANTIHVSTDLSAYLLLQVLAPIWFNTDWILSVFGDCKLISRNKYQKFVQEADLGYSPWEDIKQQIYLGSEQFVTKTQSNIDPLLDLTDILSRQYMPAALSLINYKQQASSRDEAIRLAYASGHFSMKEVGHYFGLQFESQSNYPFKWTALIR